MGQQRNCAAMKEGVQIYLSKEECALSMGQRSNNTYAAPKDAQIKLKTEECA